MGSIERLAPGPKTAMGVFSTSTALGCALARSPFVAKAIHDSR